MLRPLAPPRIAAVQLIGMIAGAVYGHAHDLRQLQLEGLRHEGELNLIRAGAGVGLLMAVCSVQVPAGMQTVLRVPGSGIRRCCRDYSPRSPIPGDHVQPPR